MVLVIPVKGVILVQVSFTSCLSLDRALLYVITLYREGECSSWQMSYLFDPNKGQMQLCPPAARMRLVRIRFQCAQRQPRGKPGAIAAQ